MIRVMRSYFVRYAREEKGAAAIEFVLYFSLLFVVLAASVEMGHINLRHAMLERSVNKVVRDIRLNTGEVPTYESLRSSICAQSHIVDECESNLVLELREVDPREFQGLPAGADCMNAAEEPRPVRQFEPGTDNALMLMRACVTYRPIFPTSQFSSLLQLDSDGYSRLVVRSAFVQEPR